jgi:ribonucleotide monophosphatase NagD (HAD superfamily)
LGEDIDYVATNPDWVCPTWYGFVPDCGSFADIIYNATKKRPKFIGKPEPEMAYLAMKATGFSKEETVLFGDRLYTDIACGVNAGISTVFVLSGEGTMDDLEKSEVKPEFIYENIKKIYEELTK